jgi:hypothetical protein
MAELRNVRHLTDEEKAKIRTVLTDLASEVKTVTSGSNKQTIQVYDTEHILLCLAGVLAQQVDNLKGVKQDGDEFNFTPSTNGDGSRAEELVRQKTKIHACVQEVLTIPGKRGRQAKDKE